MIPLRTALTLASALALATSCGNPHLAPADSGAPRPAAGVLVTVDGRPITQYDVQASIHTTAPHGGTAENEHDALDRIIQEDVIAQRAIELGLDRDPQFIEQDRNGLAAYHAWRRTQLVSAFSRHQTATAGVISDAEARAYYDANAARIRTEVHVLQLLFRDLGAANEAVHDLATVSFEDFAHRLYPALPEGQHPWDLGWLTWNAVPEQWRTVVDQLTPDHNSDVIPGPNRRYWVIRLVERREAQNMTFEAARPAIVELLAAQRTFDARTNEGQELRRRARIVYITQPTTTRAPSPVSGQRDQEP